MKFKKVFLSLLVAFLCIAIVGCKKDEDKDKTTTYKISYNANGGQLPADVVSEYDGTVDVQLPTPTKDGAVFESWAINSLNGIKIGTKLPGSTKANVTLFAIWQTKVFYTITYETNEGVLPSDAPSTYEEGSNVQLPTPTLEGKVFGGWYTDAEFKTESKVTSLTKDNVTLYARWESPASGTTHSISYALDGGTLPSDAPMTFDEGSGLWDLPVPTKEGFRFVSWSQEHILAGTKEDVTLTAVWEEIRICTITYILGEGTLPSNAPTQFDAGVGVKLENAIPNDSSLSFLRWENEKGETVTMASGYSNITLTAVYGIPKQYKPRWELNQIGFQGKGMTYEIKVLPVTEYDPFDPGFTGSQQDIKQQHQSKVQTAYDIKVKYSNWEDDAPWGPERVKKINQRYLENTFGDVYVVTITSQWIPTLVKGNSIAELYDMNSESGIFAGLSYDPETQDEEGYIQDDTINQAASVKKRVYGYAQGAARPDYFMYYNVDKVKTLNLEDPAELWMKGEWTMSKFEKWVKDAQTKLGKGEYVLDMGFAESIIGLVASNGNKITDVRAQKLYLTNSAVTDRIQWLQDAYAGGLYYARGVQDVSPGFQAGATLLHHGDLWFLKESTRFNPLQLTYTIGVVPYPTADGEGGTPVTTTDVSEAIQLDANKYLTDAEGNYIKTVDMSESSFKVPFTGTSCYAILNIQNGKNGINAEYATHILHDLVAGLGDDPNKTVNLSADESYRNYLESKLDRAIDVEVIMSCQGTTYFELMELLSMTVGGGSHFGDGGFWPLAGSIVKSTDSAKVKLNEVLPKYKQAMRDLGYNIQ